MNKRLSANATTSVIISSGLVVPMSIMMTGECAQHYESNEVAESFIT